MSLDRDVVDLVVIDGRRAARPDLKARGRRAARALSGLGVEREHTVAILMRNDFAIFEVSLGVQLLAAYSVPLNWHNKPPELDYVLSDCSPRAIVGHADLLLGAASVIPEGLPVLVVPTEGNTADNCPFTASALSEISGSRLWSEFVDAHEEWTDEPRTSAGAIIYTSGTTGNPKGVLKFPMEPDDFKVFTEMQAMIFGMSQGARALVLGPLYHSSPDANARSAFAASELLVLQSRFDPEQVLAAIEAFAITHIVMVPTMFVRLLKLPAEVREQYDTSSLKSVTHTGGPCPPDVKRQMIDWWGPVLNEVYGGTEMGCAFFCRSEEWLAHPGTVGRPLPGTRYAIVDVATQEPVARGGVGEIYAYNPVYGEFTYLGRDQQRRAVERDGMITIGDMGYLDDDGYLYLSDRIRDMVISGGVNIYPAEIEAALISHEQVWDCAVFGVPDDEFGESLVAAVERVPGSDITEHDVQEYLRSRISGYKIPRRVEFHDKLPREESGKIFKRKLRDPYWVEREKAI